MVIKIAVAGKGGTGKTTFASLVTKLLVDAGKAPVLAVDADANANLDEALGLEINESLSEIMNNVKDNIDPLPAGMTKDQYLQYKMHQSLAEGDDIDLLVMGGPEGDGCYCFVNNILKGYMNDLIDDYSYVVVDNEAGMEHLSRRTTHNINYLFVISDSSARGIRSAGRMKELAESLKLDIKKMYLVVTKVVGDSIEKLMPEIEKTGLELIGTIPYDETVALYDLESKPLVGMPDDSPVVISTKEILKKAGIL